MKFRTKMIVVFLTVILAPVLMLVLTFWGINRIQIESLRQSYGITDTEGLIASDYFQMFSRLTQSMRDSAQEILDGDVACLTDPDYLDTFNEELEEKNSFLVIRRDGEIVYSGDDSIGKELYRRRRSMPGRRRRSTWRVFIWAESSSTSSASGISSSMMAARAASLS